MIFMIRCKSFWNRFHVFINNKKISTISIHIISCCFFLLTVDSNCYKTKDLSNKLAFTFIYNYMKTFLSDFYKINYSLPHTQLYKITDDIKTIENLKQFFYLKIIKKKKTITFNYLDRNASKLINFELFNYEILN